jgi:hypothetical protein
VHVCVTNYKLDVGFIVTIVFLKCTLCSISEMMLVTEAPQFYRWKDRIFPQKL